jgi:hypothetical protein
MIPSQIWPDGKSFAFTIFDDTDAATTEAVRPVYAFLADHGLRTTKSCWPIRGTGEASLPGDTCEDPHHVKWLQTLQDQGFEIGFHLSTFCTSRRNDVIRALDRVRDCFGHDPYTAANHTGCDESMYWGSARLSGARRLAYNLMTRFRNNGKFRGHVEGDDLFWGDLCRQRVRYFRNFTFPETNTLAQCPAMPYTDPLRPFVNYWFAGSDAQKPYRYAECLSEKNQDALEAGGGACILYTHFAFGFNAKDGLDREFERLTDRLSRKNGWFVPTHVLLDYLLARKTQHEITAAQRRAMEWRWLWGRIRSGGTT